MLEDARRIGIRILGRNDGDTFEFGGFPAEVCSPPAAWVTSAQPWNNDSLVLRLRFPNSSALLEGDAERVVEERMVTSQDLRADLLKVGHYGSNTSSSLELLNAVHPRWAIISVGACNTFGHPRIETLEHLQGLGTATYPTDRNGAVTFYLDGQTVNPELASL